MSMTEDIDVFLNLEDFADTATVTPANGAPAFTIVGIFDEPFVDGEAGGAHLETGMPTVTCKEVDAQRVQRGDSLAVKGREFQVIQVQPDGTGMAVLKLAP